MKRLHHSYAGHLRMMQISTANLFIFVEGKQSDPFFYGGICASIPDLHVRYEICTAEQLPSAAGGKQALINYFSFLRQRKALVSSLGSEKTTCIFILDKDLDDLRHCQKRSPHVIYTQYYDVQNYIFMHADLLTGAASAASVDPARLRGELSDAAIWCLRVATLWREWICLCLRVMEDNIPCGTNYRVVSRVQTRYCGATDAHHLSTLTRDLAIRCGLSVAAFKQRLAATSRKVDRYFAGGQHHRIFKGKWFAVILADEIDRIMAGHPYDRNGLAGRLPASLAATLHFTMPWADYFRNPIRNIVAML